MDRIGNRPFGTTVTYVLEYATTEVLHTIVPEHETPVLEVHHAPADREKTTT